MLPTRRHVVISPDSTQDVFKFNADEFFSSLEGRAFKASFFDSWTAIYTHPVHHPMSDPAWLWRMAPSGDQTELMYAAVHLYKTEYAATHHPGMFFQLAVMELIIIRVIEMCIPRTEGFYDASGHFKRFIHLFGEPIVSIFLGWDKLDLELPSKYQMPLFDPGPLDFVHRTYINPPMRVMDIIQNHYHISWRLFHAKRPTRSSICSDLLYNFFAAFAESFEDVLFILYLPQTDEIYLPRSMPLPNPNYCGASGKHYFLTNFRINAPYLEKFVCSLLDYEYGQSEDILSNGITAKSILQLIETRKKKKIFHSMMDPTRPSFIGYDQAPLPTDVQDMIFSYV